jgi:tetratricopeptide (TPR) repeat protein
MTDMLRARYASHGKTKIIGLSWYSKTEGYGAHRRIALRELVAALPRRDVLYIDLQYGDTAAEREAVQREFPDFLLHHDLVINQMVDLDGFAAQVTACDMVITIGNTTAHMAGALGVPAAVLLPIAGLTWYWFKDRAKSPWYPSLNLLRKTPGNGWKPALAGLLKLVEHCDNKPAPTFGDEAVIKELGKDLHERGRQMMGEFKLEEAKAAYRQVLAAEPDNIAALNNLAMVTQHEGHYSAARRLYDQAIRAAPDNLTMRYYRSICHLTEGNLAEGWADFTASEPHWRNMQDSRPNLPWMNCLLWDGSDLRDKKILVWGDQGMGDEIVYISMVPELIARGAQVTIECMDRLVPLVARSFPQTAVLTRRDPPLPKGDFDFHAPGMWLASRLRPTMNSFPPPKPFLKADAEKTARLRQRYQTFGRKRILGLSWYTSSYPWGLKRSIPLPDMLKPLALDDLLIVDLQYADTKDAWAEARKVFPNLAMIHDDEIDQFKDIDSYAAQVAACDFVLTISNTTSHVAGALGIPACVLMADVGLTWYWFTSGEACPWYSSLTLLRPEVPDRLKRAAAMASGAMSS